MTKPGPLTDRQYDAEAGSIALGERIRALMGKPQPEPIRRPLSFDEQMIAVANGARLIEVRPIRRADPDRTLGGVSWL